MHNLSSSGFADKIGVQRSSVSHILTGRNKPSLDFIEKTLSNFPRVNADWLIMGKSISETSELIGNSTEQTNSLVNAAAAATDESNVKKDVPIKSKSIERIIVFYTDGTFEETLPPVTASVE